MKCKNSEARQFCFDDSRLLSLDYIGLYPFCVNMMIQMHAFPHCKRSKGSQAAKGKLCLIILLPIFFGFHKRVWTRECWKAFETKCWREKWVVVLGHSDYLNDLMDLFNLSELPFLPLQAKYHLLRTVGYSG